MHLLKKSAELGIVSHKDFLSAFIEALNVYWINKDKAVKENVFNHICEIFNQDYLNELTKSNWWILPRLDLEEYKKQSQNN